MRISRTAIFAGSKLLIGWCPNAKTGLQWRKGVIDRPGVLFSSRNSGEIFYGDERLVIQPGDMVLYDPLPRHCFVSLSDWSYYYFHLPESMIEKWKKIPCNTNVPGVRLVHFEKFDFTRVNLEIKEAYSLFLLRRDGWEDIAEALLRAVLARFFQKLPGDGEAEKEQFEPAIQNLSLSGNTKTMDEMARACGMSRTDFFRKFRNAYGCSPGEYRNHLLISQAKILLCSTDFRIREIASQLHFNDCYYFSKFFRTCTGFTPSAWRKANMGH